MFAQSFRSGLFSACIYSWKQGMIWFLAVLLSPSPNIHLHHPYLHLCQPFLLNELKNNNSTKAFYKKKVTYLMYPFKARFIPPLTPCFFCSVRALTPVVLSCTRGLLKTSRGVKLAPLTHPASLKKHCRGTSQTGPCR